MTEEPKGPLGPTGKTFKALSDTRKKDILSRLEDLSRTGAESAVRPSVAYLLAEARGVLGKRNTVFQTDIQTYARDVGAPDGITERNLRNFLSRETGDPRPPLFGCCALYAVHLLEQFPEKFEPLCFGLQRRVLGWVAARLRGEDDLEVPVDTMSSTDAAATDRQSNGVVVQRAIQNFINERLVGPLSDADMRTRLFGDEQIDKVGFMCLRAALNQPGEIIQSYLTILAPERSRTPFWTFAHFYVRNPHDDDDVEPRIKAAGGIILTTRTTLYLAGGEGWLGDSSTIHERTISEDLKAQTLTAFAFPIQEIGGVNPILAGVTLTTNVEDKPIVGRVALKRVMVDTHHDVVGTVKIDNLADRLRHLYEKDVLKRQKKNHIPKTPSDTALQEEARRLVAAINNTATFEFMDACEIESGTPRSSEYFADRIRALFREDGVAKYARSTGEDYTFDKHRWTHMLGWKTSDNN